RGDVSLAVEQHYVPVAVDVQKNPGLSQQFGIHSIPADVILTPTGQVVNKSVGGKNAQDYLLALSHFAKFAQNTLGPGASGSAAIASGLAGAGQPGAGSVGAQWQPPAVPLQASPTAPRVGQ